MASHPVRDFALGVAIAVAAAACATTGRVPEDNLRQVNSILDDVSALYAEEGASSCLPTLRYRRVDIVDEHRLIFRGAGDKAWLNDLRGRCHGLRRSDVLVFELRGSRVCALDLFSATDDVLGRARPGPTCTLGNFKPIGEGHARMIEELLTPQ
jgi:hypothetical protein